MRVGDKTVIRANKHLYVSQPDGSYRRVVIPLSVDDQFGIVKSVECYPSIDWLHFVEVSEDRDRDKASCVIVRLNLQSLDTTVESTSELQGKMVQMIEDSLLVMSEDEASVAVFRLDGQPLRQDKFSYGGSSKVKIGKYEYLLFDGPPDAG